MLWVLPTGIQSLLAWLPECVKVVHSNSGWGSFSWLWFRDLGNHLASRTLSDKSLWSQGQLLYIPILLLSKRLCHPERDWRASVWPDRSPFTLLRDWKLSYPTWYFHLSFYQTLHFCPLLLAKIVIVVQSLSCSQFFCDPMDCSPPGSSVYGISQARIL